MRNSKIEISKRVTVALTIIFCFAFGIFAQDVRCAAKEDIEQAVDKAVKEDESFAEEVLSGAVSEGYEKALKKIGEEEISKEKEINIKLEAFAADWINLKTKEKKAGINRRINQDEYKPLDTSPFVSKTSPYYGARTTPPFNSGIPFSDGSTLPLYHLRYYLRDATYFYKSSNIRQTNFSLYPYEAEVLLKEELYVEQAPLVNRPRSKFQHTVETDMKLTLQYQENTQQWRVLNIDRTKTFLRKIWPQEVTDRLPSYFIPRD